MIDVLQIFDENTNEMVKEIKLNPFMSSNNVSVPFQMNYSSSILLFLFLTYHSYIFDQTRENITRSGSLCIADDWTQFDTKCRIPYNDTNNGTTNNWIIVNPFVPGTDNSSASFDLVTSINDYNVVKTKGIIFVSDFDI